MTVEPPSFILPGPRPSFSFDVVNGGKTVARLIIPFVRRFHALSYKEHLPPVPGYEQPPIQETKEPTEVRLLAPNEHNGSVKFEEHEIPDNHLADVDRDGPPIYNRHT